VYSYVDYEWPYLPWFGSLIQFATQPREFLQRAAAASGGTNVFTIQLFGRQMTFLMGTEGHAHFFRAKETVFDIREACTSVHLYLLSSGRCPFCFRFKTMSSYFPPPSTKKQMP
jgi:hypothetical protein